MRPKSKGSGIMVSDFITERDGYLALTEDEYQMAKQVDPTIRRYARQQMEYGEAKERFFSGFSVGFCINEEKVYLLPTIARKITCRRFD